MSDFRPNYFKPIYTKQKLLTESLNQLYYIYIGKQINGEFCMYFVIWISCWAAVF